jgi:chemotaxis protein CheD
MSGSLSIASAYTHRIVVGVGDMAVSGDTQVVLSTYALGSCVGIAAFDPINRSGGLLHIMLPDSAIAPAKAAKNPAMFADTGFAVFFRALRNMRAYQANIQLMVAGGANVLCGPDPYRIGERNARVTLDFLSTRSYSVRHTDIGGGVNRALHLEMATGLVTLKTPTDEVQFALGF